MPHRTTQSQQPCICPPRLCLVSFSGAADGLSLSCAPAPLILSAVAHGRQLYLQFQQFFSVAFFSAADNSICFLYVDWFANAAFFERACAVVDCGKARGTIALLRVSMSMVQILPCERATCFRCLVGSGE